MRKMGTIPLMTGVVLFLRGKVGKEVIIQELSENYPLPIQEITAIVETNW